MSVNIRITDNSYKKFTTNSHSAHHNTVALQTPHPLYKTFSIATYRVQPKYDNSVIIYSPSSFSKPLGLSFSLYHTRSSLSECTILIFHTIKKNGDQSYKERNNESLKFQCTPHTSYHMIRYINIVIL